MEKKISGVIFDMDGLLFDSERLGMETVIEAGKKQGKTVTREICLRTLGVTKEQGQKTFREKVPGIDVEKLYDDFGIGMRALAERGEIPLKTGARELLEKLKKKGIPCAVASSSPEEYVRLYLDSQGITGYFSVILGGPKGIRSKPEPDIFLMAAGMLGISPGECLVLEDSRNGVKAGRAAGMTVCMVPDLLPWTEELAGDTDCVVRDLNEAGERFFA